jgi:hypothetical protein
VVKLSTNLSIVLSVLAGSFLYLWGYNTGTMESGIPQCKVKPGCIIVMSAPESEGRFKIEQENIRLPQRQVLLNDQLPLAPRMIPLTENGLGRLIILLDQGERIKHKWFKPPTEYMENKQQIHFFIVYADNIITQSYYYESINSWSLLKNSIIGYFSALTLFVIGMFEPITELLLD